MSTAAERIGPRASSHEPSEPKVEARGSRLVALLAPDRWWRTLRSVRFALILMALIALACIVGTLVKQEPYDATQAIARYGQPLGLLIGLLGLSHLYHTGWFLALLALFVVSTVACTVPRLRWRVRSLGSAAVHLSIVFIVAGALVKGFLGTEGMVSVTQGEAADGFQTERGVVPLGFRLRLDSFIVERHEAARESLLVAPAPGQAPREVPFRVGQTLPLGSGSGTVEVLRYVPHFVLSLESKKVISASDQPVNPAIQVRVKTAEGETTRWLFARFPDLHGHGAQDQGPQLRYVRDNPIKSFASHVTLLDSAGAEKRQAVIRVNEPLREGRFTFYQSSYDPETERSSTLEVVSDPGVPLVFTGFILMPLGIAFVFYVQPLLRRGRGKEQDSHRGTEGTEKRKNHNGV